MSTLRGKEGFDIYYEKIFSERWHQLKHSFQNEPCYLDWNPFAINSYFLDSASVLAAYALPLEESKSILDMCAAPGGKSLVLAHRMNSDANLLCNERSASRRSRLSHVLDNHLPASVRSRVNISSNDGALMCKRESSAFDAILLDAPCSSERHVYLDEKYLLQWSSARIKNLSITQWSLLSSAFRLLKEGGYIVYSTCALSPSENDGVIRKLLKKFDTALIQDINITDIHTKYQHKLPDAEKTEYGYHVLPDTQNNAGPLYFCLIKKVESC